MVNYLGDSKIARLLFGEFFSLDLQELYFKLLAKIECAKSKCLHFSKFDSYSGKVTKLFFIEQPFMLVTRTGEIKCSNKRVYTFSFKRIELNDPKVKLLDSKGVIAISNDSKV